MKRYMLFIFIFSAMISGCTSINEINEDPNILLQAPYNRINYIAEPKKSYKVIDVVEVTTQGNRANVLNTVPKLYRKVLERFPYGERVWISNIGITSFSRREFFWVPYDDCKLVRKNSDPEKSDYQRDCITRYRTEVRDILYQKATADVLILKEEK